MNMPGGVIAAAATACAAINEKDKSRPWREWVDIDSDKTGVRVVGSDGRIVVRVTCSTESDVAGCLHLDDAKRIKAKDGVVIETHKGGTKKTARLCVVDSEIEATLVSREGKGRLQEPYPPDPVALIELFPDGRPIARLSSIMLRRAASALLRAGAKSCEVHFAKGVGGGVLFFVGQNDEDDLIEVAIGQTETVERKSKTGEVVERQVPLPLFDAAKDPPKDAEPQEPEDPDAE